MILSLVKKYSIFAVCSILVLIITFFYSQWLFDTWSFLDGFAYLGLVVDPIGQTNRFPLIALGDLLPVFWPEHFFYWIFNPQLGRYLYKILLVSSLLTMIFQIAKDLLSKEYGWLALSIVVSNSYFLSAMGSDYPLGMVIFYLTTIIFFIVNSSKQFNVLGSLAIGFSACLMVSSAILSIVYLPALAILYFGLKRKRQGKFFGKEDFFVIAGFLGAMVLLSVAYHSYSGSWIFFKNTLDKMAVNLNMDRTPGNLRFLDYGWMQPFRIVFFYFIIKIFESIFLFIRENWHSKLTVISKAKKLIIDLPNNLSEGSVVLLSVLSAVGMLTYLQVFKNQGTISDPFYYNQLLPLIALSLVAVAYLQFGEFSSQFIWFFLPVTVIALLLVRIGQSLIKSNIPTLYWLIAIALILSFFKKYKPNSKRRILFIIFGVSVVLMQAVMQDFWSANSQWAPHTLELKNPQTQKTVVLVPGQDVFTIATQWLNTVNKIDPNRDAYIWYDISEPFGQIFRDCNAISHFWQERLINEQFPQIKVADTDWHGPRQIHAQVGQEVLIATSLKTDKLKKLAEILAEENMRFEIESEIEFAGGPLNFDVLKLKLLAL